MFAKQTLLSASLGELDLYSESRQLPGFERNAVGFSAAQVEHLTPHLTAWVGARIEQVSIDGVTPLARVSTPTDFVAAAAGNVVALQAGLAYSTVDLQMRHGSTIGVYAIQADPRLG